MGTNPYADLIPPTNQKHNPSMADQFRQKHELIKQKNHTKKNFTNTIPYHTYVDIAIIFSTTVVIFILYKLYNKSKTAFYRMLTILSILWLIIASNKAGMWSSYGRFRVHFGEFLTFGILPLIVIWGFIWVISGIKKS